MQQTVVIGAGLMGIGIATHFARFHQDVLIYDTDPARLAEVAGAASAILSELRDAGQFSDADKPATLARLHVTTSLDDLAHARLLIEAIPEHALYAELEKRIAPDAIIASNTSGLPPDALAAKLAHPSRLLIAHFWNPPHFIPLVEVVPRSQTDPQYVETVYQLLRRLELEAVKLDRAAPGFIGNRLQFALLREALHIVHSGIASAGVVDQVMRASLGRRYAMVGPLEAADMTGLNTVLDIYSHLLPELAQGDAMLELIKEKTQRGDTGERSGDGFYHWDEARRVRIQQRRAWQLRHALKP